MNNMDSGTNKDMGEQGAAPGIPPRQNPYEEAYALGFDVLRARPIPPERLEELGVSRTGDTIKVPLLNNALLVDLENRTVTVDGGGPVKVAWALLTLHYLCAEDTALETREVSLSHFLDCRSYCSVFDKRVIKRFLGTVGRTRESFEAAAEKIGGTRAEGKDVRYSFSLLPRVPLDIVRFDADEEFGPDANVLYRADAQRLLPAEDRIVAAELLLEALSGRSIEEAQRQLT